MAANPCCEWLTEVAADAVVVRPVFVILVGCGNRGAGARAPEQAAIVTIADVVVFSNAVADGRRVWLSAHGARPMVLFWWHDTPAGQLRFSMVSAAHGQLPFGCEIVGASSLASIVSNWLRSKTLHGIPWSEFQEFSPDEVVTDPPNFVLPVWSVVLNHSPNPSMQPIGSAGG